MHKQVSKWIVVGAAFGAVAVVAGAFGSHALPVLIGDVVDFDERVSWWETGSRFLMFHSLAILAIGFVSTLASDNRTVAVAGASILAGTLLFSGCLFAMALTGVRILGAIVPVGGLLLIFGWVTFALAAWQSRCWEAADED